MMPGDRITVQVKDRSLTSESISGGVEVAYPWSMKEKRPCTVIADHPRFIVCECDSRPAFFGMSVPYRVTFDKVDIENGKIIVEKARLY